MICYLLALFESVFLTLQQLLLRLVALTLFQLVANQVAEDDDHVDEN